MQDLTFDNRFTRDLPADPEIGSWRRQVLGACYSRVQPTPTRRPELVAYSREVAQDLGLNEQCCQSEEFLRVFSGNQMLPTMDPHASCYGGHQFGHWAGQLGDGRAINLGEVISHDGERHILQVKGAGPTPYSRRADGLAVLRSSLREFLCSEAMYHLGVPTTRALSVIVTGDEVIRDMFYDGQAKAEPGAVVCRVAPSFTRFGHFEIFAMRNELGVLSRIMDYTVRTNFPHLGEPSINTYHAWFDEVCRRTAEMVVQWMRVGFVHGVMNTDNMSVLGLTIDYGPYGWLEDYDPMWTPNTTDAQGRRYRFGQQHQVALWNLTQLARSLAPLVEQIEPLQTSLENYSRYYTDRYRSMVVDKLGLDRYDDAEDGNLFDELWAVLELVETDMTLFFRALGEVRFDGIDTAAEDSAELLLAPFRVAYYIEDSVGSSVRQRSLQWMRTYARRLHRAGICDAERRPQMQASNPRFVLRNYLAQLAIDRAEEGDYSMTWELLDVLRRPYDDQPGKEVYAKKRPEWARNRAGCSMLSCSS
ncbi:MAG: YdiU family protein [Candidatus Latescibacterota bacterium]|nr:YdiU family protein [Candidatus Latescibacterota bacterium]